MRRDPHTEALVEHVLAALKTDRRGRYGFTEEGLGALAAELEVAGGKGCLAEAVRALVELGELIEGGGKGSVASKPSAGSPTPSRWSAWSSARSCA